MIKLFSVAHVPEELAQAWLQHLRDFDVAHPGCHFSVIAEAPDMPLHEALSALKVTPAFKITQVYEEDTGKKKGP